jgi:hypothetical protein
MNGKFFSASIKFLVLALIILLAFFREPQHQWMFITVFGGWGAVMLIRLLAGRIMWLGNAIKKAANRISTARRKAGAKTKPLTATQPDTSDEKLLLGHFSCRITDKLRAVFPGAAWQWQEKHPERIARGGTGRIRIEDAGEYTHADVTVDRCYRISFAMMKIVDLQDAAIQAAPETDTGTDAAETEEPAQASIADWFDWVGKETLYETITELNTRGYFRVYIKDTGEIYVVEDGDESVKATLNEMPERARWAELVDVLAAGDLRGEIDNDRLMVSWA